MTTVTWMPIQAVESSTQLATRRSAESRESPDIEVIPGGWGNASVADIHAVCLSAANELRKHFPETEIDPVSIRHSKKGPLAIYGEGPNGVRRVLLDVRGTYWSQFAYQFSHEFCHVLCNYRNANNPNLWFEESLCETASLFAMRRMGETWKTKPPYPNWTSYASALSSYADDRVKMTKHLRGKNLVLWYREHEAALRETATDRSKNQVVAVALLPFFEKNPQHWRAISYLNQWDANTTLSFQDYLIDWYRRVPDQHKRFVSEVADLFEISVSQ